MAASNKTLGRFELTGIPPAPRGTPQIEVAFDIDANGIVSVSAKDMATGKEQSIKITASSGLSKEEIDAAIKEAEMHADDDKKKKELVEARNQADALIYSTEKSIKDLGDKVDEATKKQAEEAIEPLRKAMEGEDADEIKRLSEALTQASHKVAEAMYKQASEAGGGPGASPGPDAAADVKRIVRIEVHDAIVFQVDTGNAVVGGGHDVAAPQDQAQGRPRLREPRCVEQRPGCLQQLAHLVVRRLPEIGVELADRVEGGR